MMQSVLSRAARPEQAGLVRRSKNEQGAVQFDLGQLRSKLAALAREMRQMREEKTRRA